MTRFRVTAIAVSVTATPSTGGARQTRRGVPAFRNEVVGFEACAIGIIQRLTLEEKAQRMNDVAPAIDRLGIGDVGRRRTAKIRS